MAGRTGRERTGQKTVGYLGLKDNARKIREFSTRAYREPVDLWHQILTLHYEAFARKVPMPEGVTELEELAWATRMLLVGMNLGSSMSGLDALLAGYYPTAFGAIRHMIESGIQCAYLEQWPERVSPGWMDARGIPGGDRTPGCGEMIGKLKAALPGDPYFDAAYWFWDAMCKGAHPSGESLLALLGKRFGGPSFPPTHDPEHAALGFDCGLFGGLHLLYAIQRLAPQPDEWQVRASCVQEAIKTWREKTTPEEWREPIQPFGQPKKPRKTTQPLAPAAN